MGVSLGSTRMHRTSTRRSTQLQKVSKNNFLVLRLLYSTSTSHSMTLFNLLQKMVSKKRGKDAAGQEHWRRQYCCAIKNP
ncbi:hypothetical protein OIU74_012230 [Salix koriyanagi]|uniref:Uncharacterized protein n=1 Tax=Salix koriyanagi TaxID=2511006 RepID=A0A9Q0Q6D9_9ROSI|nr:hypothetical protein OIU74_012230 [Salix koriyanagi]